MNYSKGGVGGKPKLAQEEAGSPGPGESSLTSGDEQWFSLDGHKGSYPAPYSHHFGVIPPPPLQPSPPSSSGQTHILAAVLAGLLRGQLAN